MQDAKPWYLSAGVWGAFVTLLGSGLSLLKFRLDPALLDDLRDWVLSLVTLLGGAVALYGRIRATRRLVVSAPPTDPAAKGQNWRMNAAGPLALLVLPAALLAHASGCASLASPSAAYVAADRATYDAVAPEYAEYVRNDASLDDDQRARRQRTLETWRIRVKSVEGPGAAETQAPVAPLEDGMPERDPAPEREVTGDE